MGSVSFQYCGEKLENGRNPKETEACNMWVTGTQPQAREVESELRFLVIFSMQEWVRQAGTWWCSFHRGTGKFAAGEEHPECEHQEISAQGCSSGEAMEMCPRADFYLLRHPPCSQLEGWNKILIQM